MNLQITQAENIYKSYSKFQAWWLSLGFSERVTVLNIDGKLCFKSVSEIRECQGESNIYMIMSSALIINICF
jgi:hypothetical protein